MTKPRLRVSQETTTTVLPSPPLPLAIWVQASLTASISSSLTVFPTTGFNFPSSIHFAILRIPSGLGFCRTLSNLTPFKYSRNLKIQYSMLNINMMKLLISGNAPLIFSAERCPWIDSIFPCGLETRGA